MGRRRDGMTLHKVMSVVEAGRKGGLSTLAKRGRSWFVFLGKTGQEALRKKHPGMASQWGRLGGRPRKPSLPSYGRRENSQGKEVTSGPAPFQLPSSRHEV